MEGQKINISTLNAYNKILIYGAGQVGTDFLRRLFINGFDKTKVEVWDVNFKYIGKRFGFIIAKPDFSRFASEENMIVIIALSTDNTMALLNEIKEKFIEAGYKNIIASSKIAMFGESHKLNEFSNNPYLNCSYENEIDFSGSTPLVKPIAFYLPQFHEIPENNEWWGEGFTEWTNSSKAKPKFNGHYQPREPHDDLGYYDLNDADVIRKQAEIAKRHGIYGWCMYYYWFSGRKLLEKPIDLLLKNKDIDINFCLMWCNESWTKIWVGNQKEVLIKCEYQYDDPEKFIDDFKKYVDDERYIKIDGKPVILIYEIQNMANVINDIIPRWRKHAMEIGIGEIAVISSIHPYTLDDMNAVEHFDGETHFTPLVYADSADAIQLKDEQGNTVSNEVYRYEVILKNYKRIIDSSDHKAYLSCVCGYDNTPRYASNYTILDIDLTLSHFYNMVKYITEEALAYDKEYIFMFAWNEWAEGAYFEPDRRFGYAVLNTFSKAICGLPLTLNKE